ncbi:MAG: M1 family metallopeptidase [Betaproteobacteria bacterium]
MTRAAIAALLLAVAGVVHGAPARLDFDLALDPLARRLEGSGTVTVPAGGATAVVLAPRVTVGELRVQGQALAAEGPGRWRLPASDRPRVVNVRWSGSLAATDGAASHRDTLGRLQPAAGPEGSFLPASSGWYPAPEGLLASHRVRLKLPAGQRGLVAGRLLRERDDASGYEATFDFPHPGEGIDLMAGPYGVAERRVRLADGREARLRTWFHPAIAELSEGYLESVARYLERFEARIGPYAFTEFSVVSSPTPTGFGMPTLTYLGVNVLKLPFIRATSLGHEVLHNWWGNGVYPDWGRGNWSEGLTTYLADHAFREDESPAAAAEMRLGWLRDFAAMPPAQDQPLAAFTTRTHGASSIVGYGKCAMLFHMLRGEIGEAAFERALRSLWREQRFRTASWDDLRGHFERASGRRLAGFFAQWLERPGAPRVQLASARRSPDGQRVTVALTQEVPGHALRVPLGIDTGGVSERRHVTLRGPRQSFDLPLPPGARAVTLDPDADLFRRLAPGEAPPILREVMLDPRTRVVVLGEEFRAAAAALAAALLEGPGRSADPAVLGTAEPALVVGDAARVAAFARARGLRESPGAAPAGSSAQVWLERDAGGATLALVAASDPAAVAALAGPLPHYGKQSWLVFSGARAVARGVWPGRPQAVTLE